jgi:hypothetical protein
MIGVAITVLQTGSTRREIASVWRFARGSGPRRLVNAFGDVITSPSRRSCPMRHRAPMPEGRCRGPKCGSR